MFCVRCGRRDLTHGKRCVYCKTRLVYPVDLRYLMERDARLRERETGSTGRGLFDLPREKAKGRKYSEWPREDADAGSSSERSAVERPRVDKGASFERSASEWSRVDKGASSERSAFERSRGDAEMGRVSGRMRDGAKTEAFSARNASSRMREGVKEDAPSGKGLSDRKRENARTEKAGTDGRWSLFDRAREETKVVARPGFVEKAEASARARAEKESGRSDRRSDADKMNQRRAAEKPRASGNPVVRLPEKRAENGVARPAERLPQKQSAEGFENGERSNRGVQWKKAGEETLKRARQLIKSAEKTLGRFENTLEKRVQEGKNRLNGRAKPSRQPSRPVRTAARRENEPRRPAASMRIDGAPNRRQPPRRVPPRGTRSAHANVRSRQGRESFLEKHLRSLIAMVLLVVTVIVFCAWSTSTASGKRAFAQLGIGSTPGYILLGDDCMETGNYARAVEYYYRALSRHTTYESAVKLARAYRMTGDTEREATVLLLCADQFETEREPYERLKALYPTLTQRPESVQNALNRGAHILGDASIAQ